jgi:hypothetical protein
MFGRYPGGYIKIANFRGNFDRILGSVETGNGANPTVPFDTGFPEGLFANTVRGHHSQTGYHHPAHNLASVVPRRCPSLRHCRPNQAESLQCSAAGLLFPAALFYIDPI